MHKEIHEHNNELENCFKWPCLSSRSSTINTSNTVQGFITSSYDYDSSDESAITSLENLTHRLPDLWDRFLAVVNWSSFNDFRVSRLILHRLIYCYRITEHRKVLCHFCNCPPHLIQYLLQDFSTVGFFVLNG